MKDDKLRNPLHLADNVLKIDTFKSKDELKEF